MKKKKKNEELSDLMISVTLASEAYNKERKKEGKTWRAEGQIEIAIRFTAKL